jgi:crotonobetainyl-CoA:carnitine CoA-transferase CaiB-like acyl-CoA transferase
MILADLGAEVIKVEPSAVTDRPLGGGVHLYKGQSSHWLSMNRNKKSIVLNLETDKGRKIFHELVKQSDVVVDNSPPGELERLKIDYQPLKGLNPGIICASVTAWGSTGPYRDRNDANTVMDTVISAATGLMSVQGHPDVPAPPLRAAVASADIGGGMFAAHGVLAALYQRKRTGQGQRVDVGMADSIWSMLTRQAGLWLIKNYLTGILNGGHSFPTRDGYVVAVGVGRSYEEYCKVIEREDLLEDPRFVDAPTRQKNQAAFEEILIEEVFPGKTSDEWVELLVPLHVPCAKVNTIDQAVKDTQLNHRNMFVEIDDGFGDKITLAGNPLKLTATQEEEAGKFTPPPPAGRDTDDVLSALLGYSRQQVDGLVEEGVVERMAEVQ